MKSSGGNGFLPRKGVIFAIGVLVGGFTFFFTKPVNNEINEGHSSEKRATIAK
ncbi:hypothetical protein ACOJUR_02330 [Alicyclobacillus tolerans]|uniref:hypothetical protein n=1 Tax=Alicyclobacillus tolerans TaxID=90970 RepID=UPI003B7E625C